MPDTGVTSNQSHPAYAADYHVISCENSTVKLSSSKFEEITFQQTENSIKIISVFR